MEYVLKNDEMTVSVVSTGASLHSIRDNDGTEYLWQGDAAYWSGQAPVVFPICGSIRGDKGVLKNGKPVAMPRHGLVRKKEFEMVRQDEASILFRIVSDDAMYEAYPFRFTLWIQYTLTGREIKTTYRVENMGEETMPYFIGGHPGFNCPLVPGTEYSDYYLEFEKEETCTVPTQVPSTGLLDVSVRPQFFNGAKRLALKHELFAIDGITLDEIASRSITLASDKHDKGVRVEFEGFPYVILWSTANNGPFIAIEPWAGLSTCSDESDVFEEKRNCQYAESGKVNDHSFSIRIL